MKLASSGDSFPQLVSVRYEDNLLPKGCGTISACLVKADTVLRLSHGVLEIHHVKPTDHEQTYENDDNRNECYSFLDVKSSDELQLYQDSVKLSFVDFMLKYSTDRMLTGDGHEETDGI